jgi:PAS domain S-box-containing protein
LRGILESARDAIVSIDGAGRITLFNSSAERMFGYTSEEVVGAEVTVLMPSPYSEQHSTYIRNYEETGVAKAIGRVREVTARHKSGELFPVELSLSQVRSGDLVVYTGILRDASERVAAEATLKQRAEQQAALATLGSLALTGARLYDLMQEASALVAHTLSVEYCKVLELLPNGRLLICAGVGWRSGIVGHQIVDGDTSSQAGYTLAAKKPVTVQDRNLETRFHGPPLLREHDVISGMSVVIEGQEGAFGVLGAHTTRRRSFTSDEINFLQAIAHVLAGAAERWRTEQRTEAQYAVTRALADSGTVTEAMPKVLQSICEGGQWDLGEMWLAEHPSRMLRRQAVWTGPALQPVAVALRDSAAELPTQGSLAGRALDQGTAVWESDMAEDRTLSRQHWAAIAGLHAAMAFPILGAGKTEGIFVFCSRAVRPPDTHLIGLAEALGRQVGDFIERKRVEAELQETQHAGQQRQRLADVGAITAKVVHDLGNPLAALSMQASLLMRRVHRSGLDTLQQPAEQILATARRLQGLIQEFGGFVREQGLRLSEMDVGQFLKSLAELWGPLAAGRRITLDLQLPPAGTMLRGDEDKLRRVFDNLLKNALDAIDSRSGLVTVRCELRDGGVIRISVEDDGSGIPESADVFRLFETTKAEGTGIGLAVAKELVIAHGGSINHAPRTPRGTVFHVDLPVAGPSLAQSPVSP